MCRPQKCLRQPERLQNRAIDKLLRQEPRQQGEFARLLARWIARARMPIRQRTFHHGSHHFRRASLLLFLRESPCQAAHPLAVQRSPLSRQFADRLLHSAQRLLNRRSQNRSRLQQTHRNALRTQLQPERSAEGSECRLRSRKRSAKWWRYMIPHRSAVDDPPSRSPKQRQERLDHADLPEQIHFEDLAHPIDRHILHWRRGSNPRVVEERIQPPPFQPLC